MINLGNRTGIIIIVFQLVMIVAFLFLASYADQADSTATDTPSGAVNIYYPMFQDIQVMVLVGFGALMMFMKRYGYSGAGITFLISAIAFQYALLVQRVFAPLRIGMTNLIDADVTAAAVLISIGAVLGKTTLLQLLVVTLIEVPAYYANRYLAVFLQVNDIGGSVSVHAFGAYYGLAMSKVLGKPNNVSLQQSCYQSDLLSLIGTLFLWIFWPSFNGALSWQDGQQRAIINTYLALIGSCVVAFATSSLTHSSNKLSMAHVQNATLAGGVAIGAAADMMLMPYAALLIGGVAGAVSTLGFVYLQPWLLNTIDLHDTCGVHNLHGLPAILAGIVATIAAAQASTNIYGSELYIIFPARAPLPSTKELKEVQLHLDSVTAGSMRSAGKQASYQILALIFTLIISVIAGAITGTILKITSPWTGKVSEQFTHNDSFMWSLPEPADHDNEENITNIQPQRPSP